MYFKFGFHWQQTTGVNRMRARRSFFHAIYHINASACSLPFTSVSRLSWQSMTSVKKSRLIHSPSTIFFKIVAHMAVAHVYARSNVSPPCPLMIVVHLKNVNCARTISFTVSPSSPKRWKCIPAFPLYACDIHARHKIKKNYLKILTTRQFFLDEGTILGKGFLLRYTCRTFKGQRPDLPWSHLYSFQNMSTTRVCATKRQAQLLINIFYRRVTFTNHRWI